MARASSATEVWLSDELWIMIIERLAVARCGQCLENHEIDARRVLNFAASNRRMRGLSKTIVLHDLFLNIESKFAIENLEKLSRQYTRRLYIRQLSKVDPGLLSRIISFILSLQLVHLTFDAVQYAQTYDELLEDLKIQSLTIHPESHILIRRCPQVSQLCPTLGDIHHQLLQSASVLKLTCLSMPRGWTINDLSQAVSLFPKLQRLAVSNGQVMASSLLQVISLLKELKVLALGIPIGMTAYPASYQNLVLGERTLNEHPHNRRTRLGDQRPWKFFLEEPVFAMFPNLTKLWLSNEWIAKRNDTGEVNWTFVKRYTNVIGPVQIDMQQIKSK